MISSTAGSPRLIRMSPIGCASPSPERDQSGHAPGRPRLLSVKDVAQFCGLSEKAVRRGIDDGELHAVKLRSRLRVGPQDLEEWLAGRRHRQADPLGPRRRGRPAKPGTFRALIESEADGNGAS